jgi:hypothetical protein
VTHDVAEAHDEVVRLHRRRRPVGPASRLAQLLEQGRDVTVDAQHDEVLRLADHVARGVEPEQLALHEVLVRAGDHQLARPVEELASRLVVRRHVRRPLDLRPERLGVGVLDVRRDHAHLEGRAGETVPMMAGLLRRDKTSAAGVSQGVTDGAASARLRG